MVSRKGAADRARPAQQARGGAPGVPAPALAGGAAGADSIPVAEAALPGPRGQTLSPPSLFPDWPAAWRTLGPEAFWQGAGASGEPGPDSVTYQLWIRVSRPLNFAAGALGQRCLAPGDYCYTGSARHHLAARLARHLAREKRLHWHVDYLLGQPGVAVVATRCFRAPECGVNQATPGAIPWPGFGATDCRQGCGSHLKYLPFPDAG